MFKDEFNYEYTFSVDSSMSDAKGSATPWGLQRICITTVEKHLVNIGLGVTTLIENYGLSWVMLSWGIKILSPIRFGDKLTLRTKHISRKGVLYRRDLVLCRDDYPVAYAVTYSSLMDMAQRRLSTDRTIPEKLGIPADCKPLFDAPYDSRHKLNPEEFTLVETRPVRPSYIDPVGHVNNQRYSELSHDALPADLLDRLRDMTSASIYFTGELKYGDSFDVMSKRTDGKVEILGIRHSDGKQAFSSIFTFKE